MNYAYLTRIISGLAAGEIGSVYINTPIIFVIGGVTYSGVIYSIVNTTSISLAVSSSLPTANGTVTSITLVDYAPAYCTQADLEKHIGAAQLTMLTNDTWEVDSTDDLAVAAKAGGSLTVPENYVVTALNEKGETIASAEVTFTPGAINKTATLTWDAVPQATSYRVYRSETAGTYVSPSLLISTTLLTVDDTGASTLLEGCPPADASIPNSSIVNDMIHMSDREINAKVGCTFSVPFVVGTNCTFIPTIIRELSQDMSVYNCFMRRFSAFEVPKQWIEAYKDACKKLEEIAALTIHLDGVPVVISKEAEIVTATENRILDFDDTDSCVSMY
jgi:hypothetical protein